MNRMNPMGKETRSALEPMPAYFRDTFAYPVWRESLRAFAIFLLLFLALFAIGGELAFRQLGLEQLNERLALGRDEAIGIARDVLGMRGGRPLDDEWLWGNRARLYRMINLRMGKVLYIEGVEIRDGAGNRVLKADGPGRRLYRAQGNLPVEWPKLNHIEVALRGVDTVKRGEVRLAVSKEAMHEELEELQRSLWIRIGIAGLLALSLLGVGFYYLLYLLRKNRKLEQARQSAARASYVGLLASGLAHEIRNPLNAMNMNLQMLEEELSAKAELIDPEHTELLESTKSEIKRLERLVNNFLAYARPAQPRLEPSDLNLVVREVMRLLEVDFRQSQIELRADLEPLLPEVETDPTQFKQALINLLVNARQVLTSGGRVTVRTRVGSRGEVVLEVEDDGPGIPTEVRERIFEVFYSSRGGGTGLGLPIARQIVERHGGTVQLNSVEGQGTTFQIRLPRHQLKTPATTGEPS